MLTFLSSNILVKLHITMVFKLNRFPPQIFLVFLCAFLRTMAEASFSNCPKVSLIAAGDVVDSGPRTCRGTLVRAFTRINNIPGNPDVNGRKYYSRKTGKSYFC